MKFATFNANSIRARLPIITEWLKRESPHVLCVQETKVQDRDFPKEAFEPTGYQVVYRGQKSYNGVAVVSRLPVEDLRLDLYDKGDQEARFMSATIAGIPVINVENACSSGSTALRGAFLEVASGNCDMALALGVEKLFCGDSAKSAAAMASGTIYAKFGFMEVETKDFHHLPFRVCLMELDIDHCDNASAIFCFNSSLGRFSAWDTEAKL